MQKNFCSLSKSLRDSKKFDIQRGIHIVEPDPKLIADKVRIGYDTIAYSVDFRMLDVMETTFQRCLGL